MIIVFNLLFYRLLFAKNLWYHCFMPRLDYLHHTVKTALSKAGWVITDDPFRISFGIRKVYVDLGAEKSLLAAEGSVCYDPSTWNDYLLAGWTFLPHFNEAGEFPPEFSRILFEAIGGIA